ACRTRPAFVAAIRARCPGSRVRAVARCSTRPAFVLRILTFRMALDHLLDTRARLRAVESNAGCTSRIAPRRIVGRDQTAVTILRRHVSIETGRRAASAVIGNELRMQRLRRRYD